jgi:predicted metal-binding membrane protein
MGGMPMPDESMVSMAWMPMPGQSWLGAAATFVGMWSVMMIPMMLPSVTPLLWRYRRALESTVASKRSVLIASVAAGYFIVWAAFGVAVFPFGAALAALESQLPALSTAAPIAAGVVVVIAGLSQFTAWKARQLACCRDHLRSGDGLKVDARSAWKLGVRAGLRCSGCCAGLMIILLVIGVMDWRAMAFVTAAITAERLAPAGERVARAIGVVVVAVGSLMIAGAVAVSA